MISFYFCLLLAVVLESTTAVLYRRQIGNKHIVGTFNVTSDRATPYGAFRGIPYAKPPTGNLRFRPPEPANDWQDGYNATYDRSVCVQDVPATGSEDCLYLNIYVPLLTRNPVNLPVLVWIYGGSFTVGDSSYSTYGPDYFLNENVLFVSFNYRLGIFGFLSTGDLVSPGNYGLKDQIEALRWVKQNIAAFGGDPNKITIFGESSGAASVSYLLQTNLTRGLFRGAISNSGTSLSKWALHRSAPQVAKAVAAQLNIDTSSSTTLVNGLRQVNYMKLQSAAFNLNIFVNVLDNIFHDLIYTPTIEPVHDSAAITERSHYQLTQGNFHKVPYLLGFNSRESGGWLTTSQLFSTSFGLLLAGVIPQYEINNTLFIPISMNVERNKQAELGKKIYQKYFNMTPVISSFRNLEKFFGDDQFVRPVRETVELHSRAAPVYYYRFAYEGDLGLNPGTRREEALGVGHAEDLLYMFKRPSSIILRGTEEDFLTRYRLVRMWSNFVKTGNPTPENDLLLENIKWPTARNSLNSSGLTYLNIDKHLTVQNNPEENFMSAWQNWYDQYGRPPYDTY